MYWVGILNDTTEGAFQKPQESQVQMDGSEIGSPVEEEEKTVFLEEGEKLIRMTSVKTSARSRNNGHPHLWIAFRPSVGMMAQAIDANMDYAGVEHPQKSNANSEILWPQGEEMLLHGCPF
ncbi:hypothetical protein CEXT_285851 [Caerostris extrusa]|uniref:Uncharacterized protein n=1 Tax=Caerostris extrusa TaxID=172846 RepID=A0AAV4V002_CAEEX|nr:hypothetical protein CEXT_285851 [Caerostris extrusa]